MVCKAEARTGDTSTSGQDEEKSLQGHHSNSREIDRIVNAVVRGAGAGLCIRGGLHLLSWLFALFSRSRRRLLLTDPFRSLLDQLVDTFRYILFLGSLSGIYVGADEAIANRFGRQR